MKASELGHFGEPDRGAPRCDPAGHGAGALSGAVGRRQCSIRAHA